VVRARSADTRTAHDATQRGVRVTHMRNNTYYACVEVASADASAPPAFVDARPSDAINLAVRLGVPILVAAELARLRGVRDEVLGGAAVVPASSDSLPAPPHKRLDKTLELRVRIAMAIAEGRLADGRRLRDEVASLLRSDAGLAAYGSSRLAEVAAEMMLDLERAVREERYDDAAKAQATLSALDDEVR